MASTLYEYYTGIGQSLPSVQARRDVYQSMGLGSAATYSGSAEQNARLLAALQSGGGAKPAPTTTPAPTAQPSYSAPAPTSTPQSLFTPQAEVSSGQDFGTWLRSHGYNDENVIRNAVANPSTAGSAYNDYLRETGGMSSSFSGFNSAQPVAPNFQQIYDTSFNEATKGVQDSIDGLQSKIDERTAAYNAAVGKINDNPFYSEATRVGRVAKLTDLYNNDVKLLASQQEIAQNKISTAKADAQVKLNIAAKQYDVQSGQYQQNLQMFNNLLTSGALNNIGSNDIAQIATSTGLSTSMVQSIIDTSKKKNEVPPQLQTFDDGVNQYVVAFDSNGNVVNKQVVGSSKPKEASATATKASQAATAKSEMDSELRSRAGSDGKVAPSTWLQAMQAWVAENTGQDEYDFVRMFSRYVNTSHAGDYYLYNDVFGKKSKSSSSGFDPNDI